MPLRLRQEPSDRLDICAAWRDSSRSVRLLVLARLADMAYFRVVTADQKSRLDESIWVDSQRMSGAPCFRGTRVPVQSLIDFLEGGETIDEFIKLYPPITREQVVAVLDFANSQLLECASSLTSA